MGVPKPGATQPWKPDPGLCGVEGEQENPQGPELFLIKRECPGFEWAPSGARGERGGAWLVAAAQPAELGPVPAARPRGQVTAARRNSCLPLCRLQGLGAAKHAGLGKGSARLIGLSRWGGGVPGLQGPEAGGSAETGAGKQASGWLVSNIPRGTFTRSSGRRVGAARASARGLGSPVLPSEGAGGGGLSHRGPPRPPPAAV